MITLDIEDNFFDRKPILDLIRRRVLDLKEGYRQNMALLGNRCLGKTAIIQKFLDDLDDPDIIKIYIDSENQEFESFAVRFMSQLLFRFAQARESAVVEELDLLVEMTRKWLPQTTQDVMRLRGLLAKGKYPEAYQGLIQLPQLLTLESGKFCVIIIDEFHALEQFKIPGVFQELGKALMPQKKCLYIGLSSQVAEAKKILSEKLSLLFGHFEVLEVGPFDVKTSGQFVDFCLKGIRLGEDLKGFLVDFTGGHPFYLNILLQEILNLCAIHHQREVFLPLFIQAIENVVFNRWGILSRHFDQVMTSGPLSRPGQRSAEIFLALAQGRQRLEELTIVTGLKKSAILPRLARLVDLGIVTRNGSFLYLQDKLLRYWIRYVFYKKAKTLELNFSRQKESFRDELTAYLREFQAATTKDISSRIIELLGCFENDAFQVDGRKYKLPLLKDIELLPALRSGPGSCALIKAFGQEEIWLVILKKDLLDEGDLNVFLSEAKKTQEKFLRGIMIALGDVDMNVRIKALQEKMWIWSEREINTLLNLYHKPYIVP